VRCSHPVLRRSTQALAVGVLEWHGMSPARELLALTVLVGQSSDVEDQANPLGFAHQSRCQGYHSVVRVLGVSPLPCREDSRGRQRLLGSWSDVSMDEE
jgi:hypothetical protein